MEQATGPKVETKRGQAQKAERRRRNSDGLQGKRRRLAVDESKLDKENYEYRWVNDDEMRLHQLTVQDDWDVVHDRDGTVKNDGAGTGSEVAVQAGGASGPQRQVLLRKRRDHYNDDYAATQRRIDDQEAALKQGSVPGGDQSNTYTPGGKASPMEMTTSGGGGSS